jgi:cell wall-associated NlpC family hydrolase
MLKIKPKIKNSEGVALIIAGLTLVMISTCTTPAFGEVQERLIEKNSIAPLQELSIVPFTLEYAMGTKEKEKTDYEIAIQNEINKEQTRINNPNSGQTKFVNKALEYENTGKWVFGGSTPGAWDCSGFILYIARESIEMELYHSATAQMETGLITKSPVKGDLVGLYYHNSSVMSSHIGIYVGSGRFIHVSETRGTVVDNISDYEQEYDVRYSRIIDKERNWSPQMELEKQKSLNLFN